MQKAVEEKGQITSIICSMIRVLISATKRTDFAI
uniref:Uncharacterized protein n=1 Tax=Manihot esculenta TaxID=3983 RepID=A0A2C9VLJ6_MANES